MFKEIIRFELAYRKGRAANYIYFGIIFLLCFLAVASPVVQIGGAVGQIKPNAPYVISMMTMIMSFALTMITSAIMGVAVLRDFDHNTEALLFSTPMKKWDYLMGRFTGSFIVLILIYCGIWLGIMAGFAVGKYVPWTVDWKEKEILAFNAWHYFQPFLLFTVTNLFISGVIFFVAGALSRNSIMIYTQGILLIILYELANTFVSDMEYREIAALLDPFALNTFEHVTRYWTPAERNTLLVPLDGILLYNRLIWLGISVALLVITYFSFSFNVVRNSLVKRKPTAIAKALAKPEAVVIPVVKQVIKTSTYIQQLLKSSFFYMKMTIREIPFIAIMISGVLFLFVNALNIDQLYGTSSYPTTFNILGLLNVFDLFFLIIAIFYAGELVWKERQVNINLIIDTTPMPTFVGLFAKFLGLLWIYLGTLFILILCGVIIQASYGYYKFDLGVYFSYLYTSTLSFLVLYTLLAIFLQVIVNNKFLGFALCIVFFIVRAVLSQVGLEHNLWQFASGSIGIYSDMNSFGHFVTPFSWFKVYWFAFACFLFSIAVILSVRGSEAVMKMRWRTGKLRLTRPMLTFIFAVLAVFLFSGFYIYYNTAVINQFTKSDDQEEKQAAYEKAYKQYEFLNQPKIVEANITMELYPAKRDFSATGFYYLKNKSNAPITDIHIQHNISSDLTIDYVKFDREAKVKESNENFRYFIYELTQPLQPGDSVKMDFKVDFVTRGFTQGGGNTNVVFNGTFINNSYLPSIGYNDNAELSDDDDRRKHDLKPKERMLERDDPRGLAQSLFGDDADHIRFEMVVGTDADQIAIAPGYLQKEWTETNRKYFHYKMDAPMCNFYNIISARYVVLRDTWNDVKLEIYYHPGHEYNTARMMESMKKSLDYFSKNFSPYQYRQLRIMEFPRYATFAQSFANTIPFSEGIGFIQRVDDPEKDLDMPFYVTSHEVAHQWWGHQVMEAGVKGNAMLSESMSQYSALMVMKHELSPELIAKYLKYELDRYLGGRASERKKEQPLQFVEGQGYIHYNKASLVFFALQDYISEDSVNAAFKRYNEEWRFKDAPYPTSADLIKHLRAVTPDSLQYMITDMFETITLYENKADSAFYSEVDEQTFNVTLHVSAEKFRADSTGAEDPISINDWIDIGIYGKDEQGKDKLIYLKKHKITAKNQTFEITVKERPRRAGIDPLYKLIDRHSEDNVKGLIKR